MSYDIWGGGIKITIPEQEILQVSTAAYWNGGCKIKDTKKYGLLTYDSHEMRYGMGYLHISLR